MDKVKVSTRLRELRKGFDGGKGISFEKLKYALHDRYGVNISTQSLKDYERAAINGSTENSTKGNAVCGMRIEYIDMLADFYGVSVDYILGRSNKKTPDMRIRSAATVTGLSVAAVEKLQSFTKKDADAVNAILLSEHFQILVKNIIDSAQYALDGKRGNLIIQYMIDKVSGKSPTVPPIDMDVLFKYNATDAANKLFEEVSADLYDRRIDDGKH